ncbi:MAG: hypothetical protein IKV77_05260 [Alistipes sp.]|nr:hypothetical protein [Alistipes sp.]MBR5920079.1 hypothetical protein [Bacteroidales bacterium]
MADDQVKYTDLFSTDITSGLDSLKAALEEVVKQIAALKEEAKALKSALSGASTATKQQQQATSEDAESAERLNRQLKQLNYEEARLKAAISEANRLTRLQAQANTAASGSLNEMRAKYRLLVAEMGNYNLKTEEGRRKMQTTAAEARKLRDEIYKLESAYGQFGRNVGNYSGTLNRFSARLKEAAARFVDFNAAFLSFTGMVRFGKAIYETRKELESALVTFKALAGEIQGARIFEQIKEFAFTTPVTLNAATKAMQTMLSFGVDQERAVDILKRLGDIAAGDSDRIQRLALAYSQATQAGRLMGQDTLQFINSGFNPLYYISLRTGKSMMELRKEMQAAKIPIEQVTQAIVDATSEGGQFNGMLDKQKETMKGAALIMEGAWQNMLNEMGQDMESGIVGILKWLTSLMKNWRETMKTLKQVAISIGVAKTALLLYKAGLDSTTASIVENTVATNVNSVALNTHTSTTKRATIFQNLWTGAVSATQKAFMGLTAIMKKFLPFAIISAITMIVQKLWDLSTASKRAQEELREFEKNATEGVVGLVSQYQQLAKEWKSIYGDQKERAQWIKEHKALFDELGLSIKNVNDADRYFSVEGTNAYIKAVKQRALADAYKTKYSEAAIRRDEAEKRLLGMGVSEDQLGELNKISTKEKVLSYLTMWMPGQGYMDKAKGIRDIREYQKAVDEYVSARWGEVIAREWYGKALSDAEKIAGEAGLSSSTTRTPIITSGEEEGSGSKRRVSGSFNNSYKGITAADVLVEEAKAMRDKGGDVLSEIQLWYDKKVAIANASYKKQKETLNKEEEAKSLSLQRNIEDANIFKAKYDDIIKQLDADYSSKTITKEEYDSQRQRLERQLQDANNLVENELEERKRIESYYADQRKVAEVEHGNELLDLQEQFDEKRISELKNRFEAEWALRKRVFDLEKHTAVEERKFAMEQEIASRRWQIEHAKELEIREDELNVLIKEVEWLEKKYQQGRYGATMGRKSGNYTSISDLLWPDLDNDQVSALNSVFDQAKDALNSWMDAKQAAADKSKELADDEVSAAENALNREIELRNQGYANDVALKEKELADAKKRQAEAVKLQEKTKKQQVLMDTAMQASSMATAVANLFKQFPVYVAIPMAAVLLGAFATAKVQAYRAASTQYREGGVMLLEGGSHQSGHDVNLGIGPDGRNLRAEGGEYFAVINKRNSRKYGNEITGIVNALNSGMFEDKYIKTSDAVGMLSHVGEGTDGGRVDLSAVESGVGELVRQGEKTYSIEGGYRVMRYKNLTRRVLLS